MIARDKVQESTHPGCNPGGDQFIKRAGLPAVPSLTHFVPRTHDQRGKTDQQRNAGEQKIDLQEDLFEGCIAEHGERNAELRRVLLL